MNIKLNCKNTSQFVTEEELKLIESEVSAAHDMLHNASGAGSDYIGWFKWPQEYDKAEFAEIIKAAEKIRKESEALIVIGIGGSYLGARAAIEMLGGVFHNEKSDMKIYFAGNSLSSSYLAQLIQIIKDKDVSLNVISKSGTTTEPAIAFRVLMEVMKEKYGDGAADRIYVTTDKARGALYGMAKDAGYKMFVIPDNIGGRYSVLTPVGLLPIAVSGADIKTIMQGAYDAMQEYSTNDLWQNDCYKYAAMRNILYRKGYTIEILANYETQLHYFGEWWKQLYGESEGKDHKGIFPAAVDLSTDLHSMGQYIQDGIRNLFETVISVKTPNAEVTVPEDKEDADGLNYIAGKKLDYVNSQALLGTIAAHIDGGVPNIVLEIEKMDEYTLGNMVYFFEKACAISGYMLGVNPFDQPGVEKYKKNMFKLLGKPGY